MKDFDGDVNARDEADRTPLHHAAIENNYQQATLLLAQGADVNKLSGEERAMKGFPTTNDSPPQFETGWNTRRILN